MKREELIVVRGGGDLATGTIHRLWSAGLRVLVLEAEHPAAIRRQVSLCEAVYEGETTVEGLRAVRAASLAEAEAEFADQGYGVFKPAVGEAVVELLRPIREEAQRLLGDKAYLESIYKSGAERASYLANKTLRKVYKKVGFVAR